MENSEANLPPTDDQVSWGGSDDHSSSKDFLSLNDDSSSCTPTSQNNSSSSGGGSSTGGNRVGVPEEILARKETAAVNKSRIVVLFVLVSAAATAGAMSWHLINESEQDDFETQFSDFAFEIEDVASHNAANVFNAASSLSATITSAALAFDMPFPNATIPHFEIRGERYREVTDVVLVSYSPIVTDLDAWNEYSLANQWWIEESYRLRGDSSVPLGIEPVYKKDADGSHVPEVPGEVEYCPLWQESAAPHDTSVLNFNMLKHHAFARVFDLMRDTMAPVLSEVFDPSTLLGEGALLESDDDQLHPESMFLQPVFDSFDVNTRKVAGTVISVVPWDLYFSNLLHEGAEGITCVLRDTCGDVFTYRIDGPIATYLGQGDYHRKEYDYLEHVVPFGPTIDFTHAKDDAEDWHCDYTLHIFPSKELEDEYHTRKPAVYTVVVVMIFVFVSMVFTLYDRLVQKRQDTVHQAAVKSNAIVTSLFPADVRDRLFQHNEPNVEKSVSKLGHSKQAPANLHLKTYLDDSAKGGVEKGENVQSVPEMYKTKPIADLFPNTTVMFADICGFTAWSSVREPSQVFTLLETVYRAFDVIAKRRKIFKVETVGDCYVAVAGLPDPRDDHAVAMARFARDCKERMNEVSRQLEVSLGPDTGDLAMRFGLHSGPVTAGVLRGDKSRFQLFGDTVNTAARMESTGERDQVHISFETAELLHDAGKHHWVVPRTEVVVAKGKGTMKTFWLLSKEETQEEKRRDKAHRETLSQGIGTTVPAKNNRSRKMDRLVDFNVEVLKRLLQLIMAKRNAQKRKVVLPDDLASMEKNLPQAGIPLGEVVEVVTLPSFDPKTQQKLLDPTSVIIHDRVLKQLRSYVETIGSMYRGNDFHNFEHASHVTMSVSKLLARIVAPDIDVSNKDTVAANLHDHTYGITSDPLTQFAVVISALVHDVDHVGIPNYLLATENKQLADTYKGKSIAEQNSVDIAWSLLMEPRFGDLRSCLYNDEAEMRRFRQLLVNTVLATDIFDKELQALRKSRWDKAFSSNRSHTDRQAIDRKATIVIEHMIQASDVAHTMQHWNIYQKWNERLFSEMYSAYKTGRSSKDPSEGWYAGELGFFDNYIIPLAKKLKECGVFGVSSDEYLNYACENRREWASKGEATVNKMIEKCNASHEGAGAVVADKGGSDEDGRS